MSKTESELQEASKSLADQLLTELICSPHMQGYKLSVLELPHALAIQGKVKTFFHKQMAQEHAGKFIKSKQQQGFKLMLRNDILVE